MKALTLLGWGLLGAFWLGPVNEKALRAHFRRSKRVREAIQRGNP